MSKQELERLQKENEALKAENQQFKEKEKNKSKSKWNFRLWLAERGATFFVGKDLRQSLVQLYEELPGQVTKETMADVSTNLIKRLTRIGLFAFMVAFIPLLLLGVQTFLLRNQNSLLNNQNTKLDIQNDLIIKQNDKINIQINIEEANRRSSLIHLMSNIMDEMGRELSEDKNEKGVRDLSDELIGRMAALSHAFKPYRILVNDTLSEKAFSPERGQLLMALAKSNLAPTAYVDIYREVTFQNASLLGADLIGANLNGIDLGGADLRKVNLMGANLSASDLVKVDLREADLSRANLDEANLVRADLENTILNGAKLRGANLRSVHLKNARLKRGDLTFAYLENANIENAYLTEAVLIGVNLNGANLKEAIMIQANLKGADLKGANLYEANLHSAFLVDVRISGADLREAYLAKAEVSSTDWFKVLDSVNVIGSKEIQYFYEIESKAKTNEFGDVFFKILKKK